MNYGPFTQAKCLEHGWLPVDTSAHAHDLPISSTRSLGKRFCLCQDRYPGALITADQDEELLVGAACAAPLR